MTVHSLSSSWHLEVHICTKYKGIYKTVKWTRSLGRYMPWIKLRWLAVYTRKYVKRCNSSSSKHRSSSHSLLCIGCSCRIVLPIGDGVALRRITVDLTYVTSYDAAEILQTNSQCTLNFVEVLGVKNKREKKILPTISWRLIDKVQYAVSNYKVIRDGTYTRCSGGRRRWNR